MIIGKIRHIFLKMDKALFRSFIICNFVSKCCFPISKLCGTEIATLIYMYGWRLSNF
jgi:hypothetical protein